MTQPSALPTLAELKAMSAIKARDILVKLEDRAFLKEVLDNDPRKAVQDGVMSRLRKLAASAPDAPAAAGASGSESKVESLAPMGTIVPVEPGPNPTTAAPAQPAAAVVTVEVPSNAPAGATEEEAEKHERDRTAKCPRCQKVADTEDEVEKFFGYRVLESKKHGKIQVRQSRCKNCRSAKTCDGPRATARRAAAPAAAGSAEATGG